MLKYISLFIRGNYPAKGINDELVLGGISENLRSMAHIQVNHAVIGVGPNHRKIAIRNNVFQAKRIIIRRK